MESPPPTKKSKLEDSVQSDTVPASIEDTQPIHTSVRQQLHNVLSDVSAKSCGTPLPTEVIEQIIDHCLYRDFSELPADAFEDEEYEMLSDPAEAMEGDILENPLRKDQLTAIKDLPGKPLSSWGSEIEDIIDDGDLGIWWAHVGFPVGWKGSGELLEFDLWMCCEAHHWHGVFVFEKGATDVLLRYEPIEFCKPVRYPNRAKELSDYCADILWDMTNN